MVVRSPQEIQGLDDELHLFDEVSWDFLTVSDKEQNYEYFNDVVDTSFKKRGGKLKDALPLTIVAVTFMLCCIYVLNHFGVLGNKPDVQEGLITEVSRQEGNEVTAEDKLELASVISNYINILDEQSSYEELYDYCLNSSVFADTYNSSVSKVQYSYDNNDCYARALRRFAGFTKFSRINHVVESDGVYYCYVELGFPSIVDVKEYVYLYSNNLIRKISTSEASEANLVKFLLENSTMSPINTSNMEYCLRLRKTSNGSFKLLDDTLFVNKAVEGYSESITHMINIVKGSSI